MICMMICFFLFFMIKSYAHHIDLSLPTRRRNHRNTKKRNINYWYSSTDFSIFIIFTCVEFFYRCLSVSRVSISYNQSRKRVQSIVSFHTNIVLCAYTCALSSFHGYLADTDHILVNKGEERIERKKNKIQLIHSPTVSIIIGFFLKLYQYTFVCFGKSNSLF